MSRAMGQAPLDTVIQHLRTLAVTQATLGVPDRELLERFVEQHDECAFVALVHRHAALVWRVCRHVLHHEQDAEDALQATFVVLAKSASRIRAREVLAGWLHGVAYRIAVTARRRATVRRLRETQGATMASTPPRSEMALRELQAILDEEVSRLPAKYRAPFVLCCLEGKSRAEACRELGWKDGTLSSRLAQARKLLQERLNRRGVGLSTVLCTAALSLDGASAAPALVLESVIRAVVQAPVKKALASGILTCDVIALAEGVFKTMFFVKPGTSLILTMAVALATTGAGALSFTARGQSPVVDGQAASVAAELEQSSFVDVTADAGVVFAALDGQPPEAPAAPASDVKGMALIDYDNDGLFDLFVVNAQPADSVRKRSCLLLKNLGRGRFRDVSADAGLDVVVEPIGAGCAVVDFDCDGWPDLLIVGTDSVRLLRNEPDKRGGRRFVDVTAKSGLQRLPPNATVAWADLDGDGFPDLVVTVLAAAAVYHNNGDGTFTDVSKQAGLKTSERGSKRQRVIVADLDEDGRPDIFVANDGAENFLYLNRGSMGTVRLAESAKMSGVALNAVGNFAECGDLYIGDNDQSGRPSIWVVNRDGKASVYQNRGRGLFSHHTLAEPLEMYALGGSGSGLLFLDCTQGGWSILLRPDPVGRPLAVFRRRGDVLWVDPGEGVYRKKVQIAAEYGRRLFDKGVLIGDLDNDGRLDLVIGHLDRGMVILRNQPAETGRWIGFDLEGARHRDLIGATLIVESGGRKQTRFVTARPTPYAGADRRFLFTLEPAERIDRVTVFWPPRRDSSGRVQEWSGGQFQTDRYWRLIEGKPAAESPKQAPRR